MNHFVEREEELETLQNEYERDGSALVVLYGRRRVGKTTQISEFIYNEYICVLTDDIYSRVFPFIRLMKMPVA